ncbi:hypothetical protein DS031_04640 [Bacillus taeanensis]|uniref:DUF624 domain-containing protein n=2 Tax=Bacillus taeanensis TaxID=273032 RepID=A0A366Y3K7_9BACI|nr:hypothetical protein DS031_04640 [Bacillus taeanensis]
MFMNMLNLNSRIYRFLEKSVDFFLLNVLWIVMCLPIITIYPATTAMFGVVRKWVLGKEIHGVFKTFFSLFKDNFVQTMGISIIWTALGLFLYWDLKLIQPTESFFSLILYGIVFIVVLLYVFISIYLFPVLVHIETSWKNILRNALLLSIVNPFVTILLLGFVGVTAYVLSIYPVLILFIGSFIAYMMYSMCNQVFMKVQQIENKE